MATPPAVPVTSPYHLSANETPALALVTQSLSGTNYHQWSRAVKVALMSKNKFSFVDGSILSPAIGDPMYGQLERCNNMVMSWLHHAVSPSIARCIMWFDKALDIREDLRERFSQADTLRILELRREIHSFKQGNSSITDYYTNLKIMYDELLNLRPIPKCSCTPACKCDSFKTMREHQDSDQVMTFLLGLNDNFSFVCTQILITEPLYNLNKAFSISLQHERQMGLGPAKTQNEQEGVIFVGYTNGQSSNNQNRQGGNRSSGNNNNQRAQNKRNNNMSQPLCTYCGNTGHTEEICFKKHGYPPSYGNKNGKGGGNGNRNFQPRANYAGAQNSNKSELNSGEEDNIQSNSGERFTLSNEQYQKLIALLPQDFSNKASTSSGGSVNSFIKNEGSGHYKMGDGWLG